jgi:hypothetical protein
MALAKALKPKGKGKGRKLRERRAGRVPLAQLASCIPPKIVVPSMRSFPRPAKAVGPAYRVKIVIPTAIK